MKKRITIYTLIFAIIVSLFSFSSGSVEAKSKKKNLTYVVCVGDTTSVYNVKNFKINKKSPTSGSLRKKVYVYKTDQYAANAMIYKKANRENPVYFSNTASYEIKFLKPGTYKFTYDTFVTCETVKEKTKPGYVEKNTITYKVYSTNRGVKSIKLGKAFYSYDAKYGADTSSSTKKYNMWVKGSTAKIKVSMAKKCKINSILVSYRNKEGKYKYTLVKNGKKAPLSQYGSNGEKDGFRITNIYVGYKDKVTGTSTTFSVDKKTGEVRTTVKRKGQKTEVYKYLETYGAVSSFTFYGVK